MEKRDVPDHGLLRRELRATECRPVFPTLATADPRRGSSVGPIATTRTHDLTRVPGATRLSSILTTMAAVSTGLTSFASIRDIMRVEALWPSCDSTKAKRIRAIASLLPSDPADSTMTARRLLYSRPDRLDTDTEEQVSMQHRARLLWCSLTS